MLRNFLNVDVIFTNSGLFLSQARHITYLSSQHHMTNTKDMVTPICSSFALLHNDGSKFIDLTPYWKFVGGQQYLSITCPDICYVVKWVISIDANSKQNTFEYSQTSSALSQRNHTIWSFSPKKLRALS